MNSSNQVKIPRIQNSARVWVFSLLVVLLIVISFVAGYLLKAPNSKAIADAQNSIPIVLEVEEQVVDEVISLTARVEQGKSIAVYKNGVQKEVSSATANSAGGGTSNDQNSNSNNQNNNASSTSIKSKPQSATRIVSKNFTSSFSVNKASFVQEEEKPQPKPSSTLNPKTTEPGQDETKPDNNSQNQNQNQNQPAPAPTPTPEPTPQEPTVDKSVVTKKILNENSIVKPGDLLAEISDRPLFAIPNNVPLYRDFIIGTEGNDVKAFQQAMKDLGYYKGSISGKVNSELMNSVTALYNKYDYKAPKQKNGDKQFPLIDWQEFTPVANNNVKVIFSATVGEDISEDKEVLKLQIAPDTLNARMTILDAEKIKLADTVQVVVAEKAPLNSKITSVSEFNTSTNGEAGYDITAELSPEISAQITAGAPIYINSLTEAVKEPAVPTISVFEDNKGSYVYLAPKNMKKYLKNIKENNENIKPEKIYFTTQKQANGWVAVGENNKLSVGTKIFIPEANKK